MHKSRAPSQMARRCVDRFHHGRATVLSRRRVYRFSAGARTFELEDQVGLEPTVTCVDGLRIRSLGRWGHWSVIGGSGWFRTTCARVKRPLHLQSGLTLRIHRLDGCGGKPRRFRVARHDGVAPGLRASKRGLALGGETMHLVTCASRKALGRSDAPSAMLHWWSSREESNLRQPVIDRTHCHCATRALEGSAGRTCASDVARRAQRKIARRCKLVSADRIERPTSACRADALAAKLRTRTPGRIRTSEMPRCKRGALGRLATGALKD